MKEAHKILEFFYCEILFSLADSLIARFLRQEVSEPLPMDQIQPAACFYKALLKHSQYSWWYTASAAGCFQLTGVEWSIWDRDSRVCKAENIYWLT